MTTTSTYTVREALNRGDLNELGALLARVKLGNCLSPVKVVAVGLTAAASFDITIAAFKALSTITGIDLATGEQLPAINCVRTLRVVTAAATVAGVYMVGDAAATMIVPPGGANAAVGVCRLSDDGKTLSFAAGADITAFTLEYMPRPAVDLDASFANGV